MMGTTTQELHLPSGSGRQRCATTSRSRRSRPAGATRVCACWRWSRRRGRAGDRRGRGHRPAAQRGRRGRGRRARASPLSGRADVFAGPSDSLYLPPGTTPSTIRSAGGGRFALCGARTDRRRPAHVPGRRRRARSSSAAPASAAVRCGTSARPDALDAGAIIACEVITPGGNWSSYPAHKHDEAERAESVLEEIYYFEIAARTGRGAGARLLPDLVVARSRDRHPGRGPRSRHRAGPVRLARSGAWPLPASTCTT